MCLANIFSPQAIADVPPNLRQAMEQVAGCAKTLAKDKTTQGVPPPPFQKRATKSIQQSDWDPKTYKPDSKESREERGKKRTIRVFGIEQLGLEEYQKLMREIDSMTGSKELSAIVNKRIKEVKERLESERQAKELEERRQTRSQTEKPGCSKDADSEPTKTSQKRKCEEEQRTTTGGKKPKTTERKDKAGKTPKTVEQKDADGKKPKSQGDKGNK